jgi:hypothetical protein
MKGFFDRKKTKSSTGNTVNKDLNTIRDKVQCNVSGNSLLGIGNIESANELIRDKVQDQKQQILQQKVQKVIGLDHNSSKMIRSISRSYKHVANKKQEEWEEEH